MSLADLEPAHLEAIATAIRQGRLGSPFESWKLHLGADSAQAQVAAKVLTAAERAGVNQAGLILALEAVAVEKRLAAERDRRRLQAVWSGPDGDPAPRRDTAIVLRELFKEAKKEVLIASYSFYDGQLLFAPLYDRWMDRPELKVRMFVNIGPDPMRPVETQAARLARFAETFWKQHWPWTPRPEVYYDRRAFDSPSAILHAKLAIVDRRVALVTSANFTPHAQSSNVEAGLRVEDDVICHQLALSLTGLVKNGTLCPLPG